MHVFDGLDEFEAAAGRELGPTDWLEITQDRIDLFADATDDQWIHVDPVGAKIRARSTIADIARIESAVQATMVTTVEIEGVAKPAATIESIVRYIG